MGWLWPATLVSHQQYLDMFCTVRVSARFTYIHRVVFVASISIPEVGHNFRLFFASRHRCLWDGYSLTQPDMYLYLVYGLGGIDHVSSEITTVEAIIMNSPSFTWRGLQ